MAVRSTPLQQSLTLPTTAETIIAGSPGRTKIIKHVTICSYSSSERQVFLYLNGSTNDERLFTRTLAAGECVTLTDWFVVLTDGDALYGRANGASVVFSAFGSNLLGDPS